MNLVHTAYQPLGDGPFPTLIAIHGWGASAFDLLGIAPYIAGGQFQMLCPQGPLGLVAEGVVQGFGWYPLSLDRPTDTAAISLAVDELSEFIAAAAKAYPIDASKLGLVGFSQGGVMAYALALQQKLQFAAVAALSSWLPDELIGLSTPHLNQLPVLVQHGSRDDLIDISKARTSVESLRRMDAAITYREYDMGHQLDQHSITDLSEFLEKKILSPLVLL